MTNPKESLKLMHRKLIFVFVLLLCSISGCSKNEPKKITTSQPPPESATPKVEQQPPAPQAEVNEAVARVFRDAARPDSEHSPNFLSGDFNGDGSIDIAVILKPVPAKLDEMNQQFPPWILRDPFVAPRRGAAQLKIAADESLLVVIHGYGPHGWRDPQATQTYLLKNSVGREISARSKTEVTSASHGNPVPRLGGDSIAATLRGQTGYLYFNGAQYLWYDPKRFKGEVESRLTHPGMKSKSNQFDLLHPKLLAAEK